MNKWLAVVLLGGLFASSCSGCGNDPPEEEILECGDERGSLAQESQAIVNGDPSFDPDIIRLSLGQVSAIGAIMMQYGGSWENMCTGTLIAPDAVLTAAHCVVSRGSVTPASSLAFGIGDDVSHGVTVKVSAVHPHPRYDRRTGRNDVAVLILQTDASEVADDIVPLPYNCRALGSAELLGQWVQTVGYGCIDSLCQSNNSSRWWAIERVIDVSGHDFTVNGFGAQGVCFGDSGGPALWTMPTGEVRVIGTLHGGDQECGHRDWYPATHDSCEFIDWYAADCHGETEAGRCEGEVLIYCEENQVVTLDCSLYDEYCGTTDSGEFGCIDEPEPEPEPEPGGPCGDLTWEGRCEGDTAIWCENDVVKERRCADCLQTCGFVSEADGHYCVDS